MMVSTNRSRCFALTLTFAIPAAALADRDNAETGTWSAQLRAETGSAAIVQLDLRARSGNSTFSHGFPQSELQGFAAADGDRQFSLVREAGTVRCEGNFRGGIGAGHYDFARSPTYAAEMEKLGFADANNEDLVFLALMDLGPRRVRELRAAGLDSMSWENLRAFAIHGVTPDEIVRIRTLGVPARDPDQLIAFRIHGVSAGEIEELRSLGVPARDPDQLIAFRIHGVSPAFIRGIRKAGLRATDADDLIALRIHGVTPEFAEELRGLGVTMSDEQAIALRIHGVSASYVRKLRDAGYAKAGPDDFVRLKIGGFDAERGRESE